MKKAEALAAFGTATNLARELKISVSAVSQWPDDVPELRALQIEKLLTARHVAERSKLAEAQS